MLVNSSPVEGYEDDDDSFAGEELLSLERLIQQVQDPTNEGPVAVDEYIDVHNVEWRTKVRNKPLKVPDESGGHAATKPLFRIMRLMKY